MVHNLSRVNLENIVNSIVLYIRKLLPSEPKPTERSRDRIDHFWNDYKLLRQRTNHGDIHPRASSSSIELGDEVLVQQDKTNKLSTALNPNPFKVVSKTRNSLVVESPTGNQYSRNTSHVKHYIREGDPTPQQGSDSVSTPPTPQQELDPVPSPYQPTVPESTAGLLDRGECPDLQENVGAAPEPSRNLRPQRTRRLPERLRDYVVNFLWGTWTLILSSELCTVSTFKFLFAYFRRRDFIVSIVDFIVSGDFYFHVKEHFSEERRDVMYQAAKYAGIGKAMCFW